MRRPRRRIRSTVPHTHGVRLMKVGTGITTETDRRSSRRPGNRPSLATVGRDLDGDLNRQAVTRGRVARQPLGYVGGGSLYEYVRSAPLFSIDPYGLEGENFNLDGYKFSYTNASQEN